MKVLKNGFMKIGAKVATLALLMGVLAANSACVIWYHQPEEPKAMARFKK